MTQRLRGPARQRLLTRASSLYDSGLTIQQVADQIRYSKTATRSILLNAGVTLRPKNGFASTPYPDGDPLTTNCPKCDAPAGKHCQLAYGRKARRTHVSRRRNLTASQMPDVRRADSARGRDLAGEQL